LATLNKIDAEEKINTIRGDTLEEIFDNFAKDLMASQTVEKAWFVKNGPENFPFHLDGCAFAKHTHDLLKPTDVVCPLALIVMSIFQNNTGKTVKLTESEFSPKGCNTFIS
jgi:hypothetical protein